MRFIVTPSSGMDNRYMGLSVKPLECNAACLSCYEREIFNCNSGAAGYDVDAAIETLKKQNEQRHPSIHGGEPLMLGKDRLEKLLRFCYEKWGASGIQTNGLLIDQDFIRLFIKYNTCIGVSVDGDTGALNMGRWNLNGASRAGAGAGTQKTIDAIKLLADYRVRVSIISILRQYNAGPGRLDDFLAFLLRMEREAGIFDFRTNAGIVFDKSASPDEELTPADLAAALCKISDLCIQDRRRAWLPTRDMIDLVLGFTDATCVFVGCDPYFTSAEVPILADGSLSSCMKPGFPRQGIVGGRAEKRSNARQEALSQTDCKGCKYWHMCQGGCPGEAIDDDVRRKSRFCEAFKATFEHIANRLSGLIPTLNLQRDYNARLDQQTIVQNLNGGSAWRQDRKKPVNPKPEQCQTQGPGDHGDGHGDKPHGDHTDRDKK